MRQQSQHNYKRAAIIGVSTTFHPSSSSRTCTCEKPNAMSLSSWSLCVCLYVFSTLIYSRAWFTVVHAISYSYRIWTSVLQNLQKIKGKMPLLPVIMWCCQFYIQNIFTTVTFIWMIHVLLCCIWCSSLRTLCICSHFFVFLRWYCCYIRCFYYNYYDDDEERRGKNYTEAVRNGEMWCGFAVREFHKWKFENS